MNHVDTVHMRSSRSLPKVESVEITPCKLMTSLVGISNELYRAVDSSMDGNS
jgi:peroxiredoxin family protein